MVSQHRLESFFHEIKCNGMTIFMEFMMEQLQTEVTGYRQVPGGAFYHRRAGQGCRGQDVVGGGQAKLGKGSRVLNQGGL